MRPTKTTSHAGPLGKNYTDREQSRDLPRSVVYLLLMVLVILNIMFRYPISVSHEMGSDTTFIHTLANSLSEKGYAEWYINPLSFFGLYALSYPSATPFLLSGLSEISGISVEGCILFLGLALGVIGALSAFLAARETFNDSKFALLVAALFSLAPFFLKDTTWIGSSRGYVVAMLPVLVLLLARHLKTGNFRYLALAGTIFITICSLHRMGFLSIFLFIAFAFIPSFHRLTQRIRFSLVRYESFIRVFSVALALFGFFLIFIIQIAVPGYGGFDIKEEYQKGTFFEGDHPLIILVNMGVNFTGKVGLLTPLALVGLVIFAWKRPKNVRDKFALLLVFILIPFLSLRDYISEFMILFFVFLIVIALIRIATRYTKRKVFSFLIALLFLSSSLVFSWYMKDYWRNRYETDDQLPEDLYDTSIYVARSTSGLVLTNDGLMGGRISAVSGRPSLPLGGASTHWFSAQQLIWDNASSDNLIFMPVSSMRVRRLDIDEITFNTDEIFLATNIPNALRDWESIMFNHMYSPLGKSVPQEVMEQYGIRYSVVSKSHPYTFVSYIHRDSLFLVDMHLMTYKTYENSGQMIWYLGDYIGG